MIIRRASPDDWATVRDLRLRALREDATAFGSTLARESAFRDEEWRARISGETATFIASIAGIDAGIATGLPTLTGPLAKGSPVELVGMWVAPEGRGSGAGLALVQAVLDWARARGARAVTLWVADDRKQARRLYEKAGFRDSGQRGDMEAHPGVTVHEMVFVLPGH